MGYAPRDEEQFEPFDGLATDGSALPFDAWLMGELDARKMTPGCLSRLSGLHRSTISRLIHGERHPTVETATRIAAEPTLFRRGIEYRLEAEPDLEVVGTTVDGPSALDAVVENAPDIVLVDAALPVPAGFETIPRIKRELPSAGIIVPVAIEDEDGLFAAIKSGAAALVQTSVSPDELIATIRRVSSGAYLINDMVATKPAVASSVSRRVQAPSRARPGRRAGLSAAVAGVGAMTRPSVGDASRPEGIEVSGRFEPRSNAKGHRR